MKRAVAALCAVTAGTAGIAVIASSGSAQAGARTFTLTAREKGGAFAVVDNPPRSRVKGERARISPGDLFVFNQPLFDSARKAVGRLHVSCTATRGGADIERATFACAGGYGLAGGSIEVATVTKLAGTTKIAVTGGTGKYEGARGSATSVESGKGTSAETVKLLP